MVRTWHRLMQRYEPAVFILPALIVLLAVAIYPIIYATGISFFELDIGGGETTFVRLKNFRAILADQYYRGAILTTLIYVASTVSGSFLVGFGAALLLRSISWGKSLFRVVLIIPMICAPLVVGLMWRWMLDPLYGLMNWLLEALHLPSQAWLGQTGPALATVILVDIWEWYPLVFLILYAGLSGLPREPYEAAALDGASAWVAFRRITLPMLRPVILVALLLRTVDAFRTFDIVKVMTDGGPGTATEVLSLYLYRVVFQFNQYGKGAAGAIVMLWIIGAVSAVMFRFLYQEVGVRRGGGGPSRRLGGAR